MDLTQVAFDFGQIVIEEFGAPYKKEEIEKKIETVEQKYKEFEDKGQQSATEKYSLDYEKKFNNVKDEEDKQKELDDIMKTNPYLQAMGCSHDRRKERELFEKSTKEKLDNAEYFKNEGNKAIKDKDYDKASYFYQKSLLQFDYTFPDNEEEQNRFDLLSQQCYVNMSLVKYYLKEFDEAISNAQQAIRVNPKNVKAHFRIATIQLERDQYEKTEELNHHLQNDIQMFGANLAVKANQNYRKTIKKMEEIDNNKEVQNLKQQLVQKKSQYKKEEKKVYADMFTKLDNENKE